MILCSNPHPQYLAHKDAIDAAIRRVLDSGWYILGKEVKAFESEFAAYVDVPGAVGVGSGTEAIRLALTACGIGAGDEVITVSHTAVATVAAVELAGAMPVLVDIDPATFNLDPRKLEAAITPRTRAILPVHLYGRACDMPAVIAIAQRHKLRVIEDCSQAHGSTLAGQRVGAWGDLACFSFYPTKNLGALGDGGLVAGRDTAALEQVRLLREYGWAERNVSSIPGCNSRLDEIQAAVLRVKLPHLDDDNRRRRRIAHRYHDALHALPLTLPDLAGDDHVFHQYVIRIDRRDDLAAFLRTRQIAPGIHYPHPVHLQPAYKDRLPGAKHLPHSEQVAKQILSLPIYPELTEAEQQRVVDAITSFFHHSVASL